MESRPRSKISMSYLSPTESSARKNINIEPFYDDKDSTNIATDMDSEMKYKEDLLNSGSILFTPSKKDTSGYLTTDKIRKYQNFSDKMEELRQSPESQFYITKQTSVEKGSRSPSPKKHGTMAIIENVRHTTTVYSPDSKKTKVIHDHCSHRRRGCCSAKKLVQPVPSKVVKSRSITYDFRDPDPIWVEFDDRRKDAIRKEKRIKLNEH